MSLGVLTVESVKAALTECVTLFITLDGYQRHRLQRKIQWKEYFPQNVAKNVPHYTASHSKKASINQEECCA
jgi:hypothetical protein